MMYQQQPLLQNPVLSPTAYFAAPDGTAFGIPMASPGVVTPPSVASSLPSPLPKQNSPSPPQSFQFDLSAFEGDYTVKNSVVRVSNSVAQFLDETGDCLTVREGRLSVVFINKKCSVMLTLAAQPELRFYWTGMGDDYIEWTHCDDMNNAIRWTRIPKQYSMMPQMVTSPRNFYGTAADFTAVPVWNYVTPTDSNQQQQQQANVEVQAAVVPAECTSQKV